MDENFDDNDVNEDIDDNEDNDDNDEMEVIYNSIANDLVNILNNYKKTTLNNLDNKLNNYYKTIKEEIDNYKKKIENKYIKFNIKELKAPRLSHLPKTNNTNFLINLILQYFVNKNSLIPYFFNPDKKEKIFKKSREDPTGTYLSPSFFGLLRTIYIELNNKYEPVELHDKLKKLMNNDYKSDNPGKIICFLINQFHNELKNNELFMNKPEFNIDKNQAFNNFKNYYLINISKFSELYFSSIKIRRIGSATKYLYESLCVFDLYLTNLDKQKINLVKEFKYLFIDKNIKEKYYKNNEDFQKEIKSISNELIININRNKNKNQYLDYPMRLETAYLFNNNINNINENKIYELEGVIIIKNNNNENIYYAYYKNFVNKKWYLFNEENIELVQDENKIIDKENASLLIYSFEK